MFRFLLLSLFLTMVVRAVWRLLYGIAAGMSAHESAARPSPPERGVAMVRDPVCGTFVVPAAALILKAAGRDLYFCSDECRQRYSGGSRTAAAGGRM